MSEQLIRSIMVGDDPEMLVSDLQNKFPDEPLELLDDDAAGLIADVVDSIERTDLPRDLPSRVAF